MTMGPYYTGAGESIGLYSNGYSSTTTSTLYFEWFIYKESATQPTTPTGGSWDFVTNTGIAPTGWLTIPPAYPSNVVWVSTTIVSSRQPAVTSWSLPGQLGGIGGFSLSSDTATASALYPVFANATTGAAQILYTSNPKYLYKPSTGELSASAHVSTNGITVNSTTVTSNYTIATGNNGFSVGPISLNSGISVTVTSGQRWLIV
jgi:hypothetical protein